MAFPFSFVPHVSWKDGARYFGAKRDGGKRLHAGCDLLAPVGTHVYAVADGVVTQFKDFYLGTWFIAVDHDDFIVRYGEVQPILPKGVFEGKEVKEGELIGYVGHLKGLKSSMLHFEMYSGESSGPLTNKAKLPYMRRGDLIDPTSYLDKWAVELMLSSADKQQFIV